MGAPHPPQRQPAASQGATTQAAAHPWTLVLRKQAKGHSKTVVKYRDQGALIHGRHRFHLWRSWERYNAARRSVCWIMLNPSTADGETDDATIRRCVGFADLWGYNRTDIVNLCSFRATRPDDLLATGWAQQNAPDADARLEDVLGMTLVRRCVVAWGAHGRHFPERIAQVRRMIRSAGLDPVCLGYTRDGHPRHPVRLPYNTALELWPPKE